MPIPFTVVCDLLDECHRLSVARKATTNAIVDWFARHRGKVDAHDTNLPALLSTLLPEKRSDRVYCIQAARLEKVIGRALMLGSSRIADLAQYKQPGHGKDLGDCVENILNVTPNPSFGDHNRITVEDVDITLHNLASKVRWSAPAIRLTHSTLTHRNRHELEAAYRSMLPREAKWFTRLLLKDYAPLVLNAQLIYRCCHPALPNVLKVQEDFVAAINIVQLAKGRMLPNSLQSHAAKEAILTSLKPQIGIKVGRQHWFKGRSIKHCLDLGHGRMSVESKIDGEYCQVHIAICNGQTRIQIFSKSGKDSTEDRCKLRSAIHESLGIDLPTCNIRQECILEGELVVYDDSLGKILPFYKIRSHVARRGRLINVDLDTPPSATEHLMIIYYDILMLDGQSLLGVRHSDRFKILQKTIHCHAGESDIVNRTLIDFHLPGAASELRKAFSRVIVNKGEGLVLKPDGPYFDFFGTGNRLLSSFCIKLKKEYIGNFGDVGDFAVVGAGYNAAKARSYQLTNVKWTIFYIGCLNNQEQVRRWGAAPDFTVVTAVELSEVQLKTLLAHGSPCPVNVDCNPSTTLNIPRHIEANAPLTTIFQNPFVFDLRCFSFDKPGNLGFWTLRFPVVSKIHFDREYIDTVNFSELQSFAEDARASPDLEDSQENLRWIAKLEAADPRGVPVDAVSQLTATTIATPSPQSSRQRVSSSSLRSATQSPVFTRPPRSSPRKGACPASLQVLPPKAADERSPVLTSPVTQTRKRKTPAPEQYPTNSQRCKPQESSTHRKPLGDVDGNASQVSLTTSESSEVKAYHTKVKKRRQTVGIIEADVDRLGRASTMSSEERFSSPERCVVEHDSTSAGVEHQSPHTKRCLYAGSDCQLSGRRIFLDVDECNNSQERDRLLKAHGIEDPTVIPDGWHETSERNRDNNNREALNSILLVDSVVRASETSKLLAQIESSRRTTALSTRQWISVYDWRVLETMRDVETGGAAAMKTGGFRDPWRRWYLGIV